MWSYPDEDGITEIRIYSWEYFYEVVSDVSDLTDYAFRGQGSTHWELISKLERELKKYPENQRKRMIDIHLQHFQLAVRGRRGNNPPKLEKENDWWALGQHYGLATPLLDWASSPFVALFFAFEDELKKEKPAPKYRAVFMLNRPQAENAGIEIFMSMSDENPRLVSQSGLFTKAPESHTLCEAIKNKYRGLKRTCLLKLEIANNGREECLLMLNRMNISNLSLFPDLHGASNFCNQSLVMPGYSNSFYGL